MLQKQSREKTGLKSIEWAAGLFEGEGCISYREDQNRYCLCIAMCDGDVMHDWAKAVQYGNVTGPNKNGDNPKWKPRYQWYTSKKTEVIRILKELLPNLGLRRTEKAIEALKFYEAIN